ncbi:MAG: amidophosphoribosyltransferase, partial [Oscillospiraceae bacterium]|nr:amidophosphoribosyltransferase [Oscillospiraceae bacterium]
MEQINHGLHEECGVFGIYDRTGETDMVAAVYHALYALQHRGQESCGIAINEDGVITGHRDLGLVNEVFTPAMMASLPKNGKMAVGHVRYSTSNQRIRANSQPLVVRHCKGTIALCHNGALTNGAALRRKLELNGAIFHGTSDAEIISYIITQHRLTAPSIEAAISSAMNELEGAYSLVIMSPTKLIAARDPHGFHPLCVGKLEDGYVFASESCALDAVGAEMIRELQPGEIMIADKEGLRSMTEHCGKCPSSLCVFEYIYFARPDSVVEGTTVHEARKQAGRFLARSFPVDADVVIGAPDSGLDAAMGYAHQTGIPYGMGFINNRYVGRTFIEPTQKMREDAVRIKLSAIKSVVDGKRVILVDDSIVRGTTCARTIKLLRDAGATEGHMRVSSPQFVYPCYLGVDVPDPDRLIANRLGGDVDAIAKEIGVDSLGYLSVDNIQKIAVGCKCKFCVGCFTGKYPVD